MRGIIEMDIAEAKKIPALKRLIAKAEQGVDINEAEEMRICLSGTTMRVEVISARFSPPKEIRFSSCYDTDALLEMLYVNDNPK